MMLGLRCFGGLRGAALAALACLWILTTQPALAQNFQILHNFTGGQDGDMPVAGLSMDAAGNLYGTTEFGGTSGNGTVFRLSHRGSGWIFSPLYSFQGGSDGSFPASRVIVGPNGSLYGNTGYGGNTQCGAPLGCGTVFNLTPQPRLCGSLQCPWHERVLYRFADGNDSGAFPAGDLTFDQAGALYGAASGGGLPNCFAGTTCGVVYKLAPGQGAWTQTVLYRFTAGSDGYSPSGGVTFDLAGNLFGTTPFGSTHNCGAVFQLMPMGSGCVENTLRILDGQIDGCLSYAGFLLGGSGNLYGVTSKDGAQQGGTVFQLTPSGGTWTFSVIQALTGTVGGPYATLTRDAAGNLYGTTYQNGAFGFGSVFKLTPNGGSWTYQDLHDFNGGSGGAFVSGGAVVDAQGNLFGTASSGGASGHGIVWEITP